MQIKNKMEGEKETNIYDGKEGEKCYFCDERNARNIIMQKKASFFKDQPGKTFIKTFEGRIHNGHIETIYLDSLVFNDRNVGKILIVYDEISVMEPRRELGEIIPKREEEEDENFVRGLTPEEEKE